MHGLRALTSLLQRFKHNLYLTFTYFECKATSMPACLKDISTAFQFLSSSCRCGCRKDAARRTLQFSAVLWMIKFNPKFIKAGFGSFDWASQDQERHGAYTSPAEQLAPCWGRGMRLA